MTRRPHRWTPEAIQAAALKYASRGEFRKSDKSAYHAAIRLGILDAVTEHMVPKRISWTEAAVRDESKKHSSTGEFWKRAAPAARAAKKLGIWDEVTAHMQPKKRGYTI